MNDFNLNEDSTNVYNISTMWINNNNKTHKHAQEWSNYQKHVNHP